jgi:carbon monoxide dehydrogenase subunit G
MKLNQTFIVDSPLQVVWRAFENPQQLVGCLPGAQLSEPTGADELALTLKIKLGPITALFVGQGQVTFQPDTFEGVFKGQATDAKNNSRVKGRANFRLDEHQTDKTEVTVDIDFTITGTLAQFSRENIVRSLADQLTRDFAANLQQHLTSDETATKEGGPSVLTTGILPSPPRHESLNLMRLVWGSVTHWFRQLTGKGRS